MNITPARLADVAQINPDTIGRDWPHTQIYYIDISSVGEGLIQVPPQPLALADAPSRAKRLIRSGDTVLSTVRPNRRSMFFADQPGSNWVVSTGFAVLRPQVHMIAPRFLYACVFSQSFTEYLISREKGAAYPAVSPEDIGNAVIPLPPLKEQRAIAHILGTLDDKIELNRRMNRTLEEMARAIFKSWFVDFDPVRAKADGRNTGLPAEIAALFPDSFEDSELGEIPAGWQACVANDLASFVLGGDWGKDAVSDDFPRPAFCIRGADVPSLQRGGVGSMPIRYLKESSIEKRSLRPYDIIVEISGGSPTQSTGRSVLVSMAVLEQLPYPLICSNFCRLYRPKPGLSHFVYLWFRWLYSSNQFLQYENGTTGIKNLAFTRFCQQHMVAMPTSGVLSVFNDLVEPFLKSIGRRGYESAVLAELRDALLPKLISGELRVPNAERILERAM